MHVPLLRALDPYARGHAVARKEQAKTADFEAFVVASVLDEPKGGRRFPYAVRYEEGEPEEEIPAFEQIFAVDYFAAAQEEDDELLPEDAYDAQDLCAVLETAAHSRD